MNELTYRLALMADVPAIVNIRMELWQQMGKFANQAEFDRMRQENIVYHLNMLQAGKLVCPLVCDSTGQILALGIGVIIDKPPINLSNPGPEGYIYNMYTAPAYRRRGLARRILAEIESFLIAKGIGKVTLQANEMSARLYTSLGFLVLSSHLVKILQNPPKE